MMRAIGFLSGVALTAAAFLLVLDKRDSEQAETATGLTGAATTEQLSGVVAAIAEQVDVVEPERPVSPDPEFAPAEGQPQNGFEVAVLDPEQRPEVQTESDPAVATDTEYATAASATQSDSETSEPDPEQHLDVQAESDQAVAPEFGFATPEAQPPDGFEDSGLEERHLEAQAGDAYRHDSGAAGIHLFWSPFRSEWSAQGFARRLSSATQVPVEVVDAGPGHYRVGFSYQDETDRLAHIERIETITGLQLE